MQSVNLNGKKILVTGSPGFIGAYLVIRLLKELSSGTVVSLDNMNNYYEVSLKEWRLLPILKASNGVADTNELFIRSYQMMQMFEKKASSSALDKTAAIVSPRAQTVEEAEETYAEMKIGKVAQLVMRPILESGHLSDREVLQLQSKAYCNEVLNLNFPLLVKADTAFDKARYYSEPVNINGIDYMMCSQWIERPENNDRPFLMQWIREHQ